MPYRLLLLIALAGAPLAAARAQEAALPDTAWLPAAIGWYNGEAHTYEHRYTLERHAPGAAVALDSAFTRYEVTVVDSSARGYSWRWRPLERTATFAEDAGLVQRLPADLGPEGFAVETDPSGAGARVTNLEAIADRMADAVDRLVEPWRGRVDDARIDGMHALVASPAFLESQVLAPMRLHYAAFGARYRPGPPTEETVEREQEGETVRYHVRYELTDHDAESATFRLRIDEEADPASLRAAAARVLRRLGYRPVAIERALAAQPLRRSARYTFEIDYEMGLLLHAEVRREVSSGATTSIDRHRLDLAD